MKKGSWILPLISKNRAFGFGDPGDDLVKQRLTVELNAPMDILGMQDF